MKIFFDTEFTGLHKNTTLISLGCVDENGRTFYAEFTDYDKEQVDDWVNENVIKNLLQIKSEQFRITAGDDWCIRDNKTVIRKTLEEWLGKYDFIELVSDVCHYDMMLFADLFGNALNLPKNVNPSCHDINQDIADFYGCTEILAFEKSRDEIVKESGQTIYGTNHNALHDAKKIRAIYNYFAQRKATNDERLKQIVLQELDACGYFIADCDKEMMKHNNPDWTPYSEKSFGDMLLDFAALYNMEHEGANYTFVENCPVWRKGKPENTGTRYLLRFDGGGYVECDDYREKENCFYYQNGEYYNEVSANHPNLSWMYVLELDNLPKKF